MSWKNQTIVALDLETTGKYPLESEICEVAAIKWKSGQIVDQYQSLIKPSRPMSEEVIKIHHITNDMVESAPGPDRIIAKLKEFVGDAVIMAHHAPFDMGFLAVEFERLNLSLPRSSALCTAILSRKLITSSPNHRLQTLVNHLGLPQGQAHRALDDTKACLEVGLRCLRMIGEVEMSQIYQAQGVDLPWSRFSMQALAEKEAWRPLINAIRNRGLAEMIYQGGSRPGKPRVVKPIGIVRNPQGDFLVASDEGDSQTKRFFIEQINWSKAL